MVKKIVLMGYMGSGKTSVGAKLAQMLAVPHFDLDGEIEKSEAASIAEIFEKRGDIYFRKKEREALLQLLQMPEASIISLGGGTPCYAKNLDDISESEAITIYLKASIGELDRRIAGKTGRPLLDDMNDRTELIAKHLFERTPYYSAADHTIGTDNKPVDEIVREIIGQLK